MEKGLVGTLLRDIQDVKITKDMLDLAKHIVEKKSAHFEQEKFEDHYEAALIDLINKKRAGQPLTAKMRPAAGNVVNLMDALGASIGQEQGSKPAKKPKKGGRGTEGDAAADRRQEAKGGGGEESSGQTAAKISLVGEKLRLHCGAESDATRSRNWRDRLFW
jgi:DNA end-binding protein Ku